MRNSPAPGSSSRCDASWRPPARRRLRKRVMSILVPKDRKKPAADVPTDLERIALHKSLIAFAGHYAIEPGRIVIQVEISWNEAWSGTEQIRFYALDGDRMTLRTEPHRSATDGYDSVYIQEWEKIAQRQ